MKNKKINAEIISDACGKYGVTVDTRDCVTSTNKILKADAARLADRYVLIASAQTEGVGRYGRKFFSPDGSGVYFSVLLKPDGAVENVTNLTVAMAVAVCHAVEKLTGKKCEIKWVNDVLIDGKKVCGILSEGVYDSEKAAFGAVVVGVGINLFKPHGGFDESIAGIADGIAKEGQIDVNELVAEVLSNFFEAADDLNGKKLYEEYSCRLAHVGRRADILKNGEKIDDGIVDGVEEDYRLRVITDDGTVFLDSGEISTHVADKERKTSANFKNKAQKICLTAISLCLVIVGAFIKIPIPLSPVPITLQFTIALLVTMLLGEWSAVVFAVYIAMGLIGIPVFASGGGLSYVLMPSFGYIIGFVVGGFVAGKIANPLKTGNRPGIVRLAVAAAVFIAVVYLIGTVYGIAILKLYLKSDATLKTMLTIFIFNSILKDVILSILTVFPAYKTIPLIGLKK